MSKKINEDAKCQLIITINTAPVAQLLEFLGNGLKIIQKF